MILDLKAKALENQKTKEVVDDMEITEDL